MGTNEPTQEELRALAKATCGCWRPNIGAPSDVCILAPGHVTPHRDRIGLEWGNPQPADERRAPAPATYAELQRLLFERDAELAEAKAGTATVAQAHRDLMAYRDAEIYRLRQVAHDAIRGRTAGASALDAVRAALTGYGSEASAPETRVSDMRREVDQLRSELARERGLRAILSRLLDAPLPRVRDQLWERVGRWLS